MLEATHSDLISVSAQLRSTLLMARYLSAFKMFNYKKTLHQVTLDSGVRREHVCHHARYGLVHGFDLNISESKKVNKGESDLSREIVTCCARGTGLLMRHDESPLKTRNFSASMELRRSCESVKPKTKQWEPGADATIEDAAGVSKRKRSTGEASPSSAPGRRPVLTNCFPAEEAQRKANMERCRQVHIPREGRPTKERDIHHHRNAH